MSTPLRPAPRSLYRRDGSPTEALLAVMHVHRLPSLRAVKRAVAARQLTLHMLTGLRGVTVHSPLALYLFAPDGRPRRLAANSGTPPSFTPSLCWATRSRVN